MKKLNITKSLNLFVAGSLLALAGNVNAALITGVGTDTGNSTASNCPSYCTTANNGQFSYGDAGGEGITESYSDENTYGNSKSYASFVDGSYLPLLKVATSAGVGDGAFANAFAVQNFTNTGTETKSIELNINLHGSVQDNVSGYANNFLSASFAIILGTDLSWYPDFGTLVYEVAMPEDVIQKGNLYIGDGIDVNTNIIVNFDLAVNESFYLVTSINAVAKNGYADAWSTLSLSFDDNSNLQAAIQATTVSAPEPSTIAIFALGILGLTARRLNNKRS